MSFFGKMLGGGDLRRAAEAEAGGDYLEAARAYAAAGARHKVAEMHLLSSERAPTADGKLDALREGARWADVDDEPARKIRKRIASALLAWVRARGIITDGDRVVVAEAAALFVSAGDAGGAGICHELLGAAVEAAEAYQSAGEVERLERLLDGEADRRRRAIAVSDAVEDHRYRLRSGDPAGAILALDSAIGAAVTKERPALQALRDELAARRLAPGRLVLSYDGARIVVASPPLSLGRGADASLSLRDSGISRSHVELHHDQAGWRLVELGSKNGTSLAGVPLRGSLPLPKSGELGLGDRCAIGFTVAGDQLALEIVRGLDRGLRLVSSVGAMHIGPTSGGEALIALRFYRGAPRVRALSHALFVNGASVSDEIEPLRGDVLEIASHRWEVGA